jgi:hypothetical protein
VAMLKKAIDSGGRGAFEVGSCAITWQGHPSLGVFIEVDDGRSSTAAPFDKALADALVSVGWRRPKPNENLHDVWVEFQMSPDEPEHRFEARLEAIAELVQEGLQILRGHRHGHSQ